MSKIVPTNDIVWIAMRRFNSIISGAFDSPEDALAFHKQTQPELEGEWLDTGLYHLYDYFPNHWDGKRTVYTVLATQVFKPESV